MCGLAFNCLLHSKPIFPCSGGLIFSSLDVVSQVWRVKAWTLVTQMEPHWRLENNQTGGADLQDDPEGPWCWWSSSRGLLGPLVMEDLYRGAGW